jgi:hypothetical protein
MPAASGAHCFVADQVKLTLGQPVLQWPLPLIIEGDAPKISEI